MREREAERVEAKVVVAERSGLRRFMLLSVGWACVLLGSAGLVLPLLPTTPFLLLALWAFSLSSQRFHDWLMAHRLFGPLVADWRRYRVVPLKAKVLAMTTMAASLGYLIYTAFLPAWALALVAFCLCGVACFLGRCPSHPPAKGEEADRQPSGTQQSL